MIYRPEMIGKRIAEQRKVKGFTQDNLAKKLHISIKQLSLYENGKVTPNIDMLFSLCELLDCDFGFIIGDPDYTAPTSLDSAIQERLGLSKEAIDALHYLTGKERSCFLWGYHSDEVRRILNSVLVLNSFSGLIESIRDYDHSYRLSEIDYASRCTQFGEEKVKEGYVAKDLLDDAYSSMEEDAPSLEAITDEQMEVVEAISEKEDSEERNELIKKVLRYEVIEAFTSLLNDLYPTTY